MWAVIIAKCIGGTPMWSVRGSYHEIYRIGDFAQEIKIAQKNYFALWQSQAREITGALEVPFYRDHQYHSFGQTHMLHPTSSSCDCGGFIQCNVTLEARVIYCDTQKRENELLLPPNDASAPWMFFLNFFYLPRLLLRFHGQFHFHFHTHDFFLFGWRDSMKEKKIQLDCPRVAWMRDPPPYVCVRREFFLYFWDALCFLLIFMRK